MMFLIMKVMFMGVFVGGVILFFEWIVWLIILVGVCDVMVCVGVFFFFGELRFVDFVKFYCCIVIF